MRLGLVPVRGLVMGMGMGMGMRLGLVPVRGLLASVCSESGSCQSHGTCYYMHMHCVRLSPEMNIM